MYSLMHLRCLVFKLHKIIGQRAFQICTWSQNLNCSDFDETHLKLFVLTHMIQKKNSFVYLRCFDCDL